MDSVSVIIPAFNEEDYLGSTLDAINAAIAEANMPSILTEVLVVDNCSTDATADIARAKAGRVVRETRQSVASARNTGAEAATGAILIFVDADTHWPPSLFRRILETMSHTQCVGGAVHAEYRPAKAAIRLYLKFWGIIGKVFRMAQGATQFCTADAFVSIDGYDDDIFMGEDVDFYSRLRAFARSQGKVVKIVEGAKVIPSCRKFDKWSVWKALLLTNPVTCLLFSKSRWPWGDWYSTPTR